MKKVMKGISLIAVVLIVLVTLSGCVRVNYEVNVDKNGGADVSFIMGYDKQTLINMGVTEEQLEEGNFDDVQQQATEEGYQIENYKDDNTIGIKATKHFDNVKDFSVNSLIKEEIEADGSKDTFIFEKKLLDTKISQNAVVDLTNISANSGSSQTDSISNMLISQMKFSYKITLPYKVGDNNATTVSQDGKILEWTLQPGQINEIRFEAQTNGNMILLICLIGAVIIILIIVFILSKMGKKKKTEVKIATTNLQKQVKEKREETPKQVQEQTKGTVKENTKQEEKKVDKKEEKTEESKETKQDKKEEN